MPLKTQFVRLVRYERAKALAHARLRRRLRGRQPVLVYQMGKVASQSISRSLTDHGVLNYQVHYLTPQSMAAAERIYRRGWEPGRRGAQHLWQSQIVRPRIRRPGYARWKVITIVRDPIARNVSSFFQTADLELGLTFSAMGVIPSRDELGRLFLERFSSHDGPLTWLDDELRAVFGVDVLDAPFPRERGYALWDGDFADVVVLRYDDLSRVFDKAMSELLGRPISLSAWRNSSEAKEYGPAYARLRSSLTLPTDYLDRMYGSPYATHFWSAEERAVMRSRWEGAYDQSR